MLKLRSGQVSQAQEAAGAARSARANLDTTATRAPRNVHPDTPAERTANTFRNIQEGGMGAALGYLGGLGGKAVGSGIDPFTAAAIGGAIPAGARMGLHAAHAVGLPEGISQLMQSRSGSPMMNAAIMAALRDHSQDNK